MEKLEIENKIKKYKKEMVKPRLRMVIKKNLDPDPQWNQDVTGRVADPGPNEVHIYKSWIRIRI
jgi:hypothetical protein